MKKFCWKCNKISEFAPSTLPYVKKKTGGSQYTCISCVEKWKKDNNIKEVIRVETPDSIFTCKFIYIYE